MSSLDSGSSRIKMASSPPAFPSKSWKWEKSSS
ncbi:hypothetical protein FQN60_017411 [Etheostoma spectabile]|uniref:Uncharacterized protein n=1 Tax=Etheostoma spectabile TaxID=54343 RepID=A0A5J5DFF6_9PERO|nr:hypothetical protein FQN60_017411 [Etheostoma spectabile]